MKIAKTTLLILSLLLLSLEAEAQTPSTDWPQIQHDSQHSGITSQGVVGSFREKWRFSSAPISGRVQPIVVGGVVYIGSTNGKMYALDSNSTSTPAVLWEFQASGMIVHSAAYSYDTKYLYFGTTEGFVYALDTAQGGREVWKKQTNGMVRSAPVIDNGRVYIGSEDGVMHAYNQTSGNEDWTFSTDNNAPILSPAAIAYGVIYFSDEGAKAYALDAALGGLRWKTQMTGQSTMNRWPLVINSAAGTKVIFSTMPYYKSHMPLSRGAELIRNNQGSTWATQKTAIINHLNTYPHDRSIHVLDAATGQEDKNTPILYTAGNNASQGMPVGTDDSDTIVPYRFTEPGITPPQCAATCNYWSLYLGRWNLSTQEITNLDRWGSNPTTPNWSTKAAIISDENLLLSQGGNNLYVVYSSRGLYFMNLSNNSLSGIVLHAPTDNLPYSSSITVFPSCGGMGDTCSEFGPKSEDSGVSFAPVVIADGKIFYQLRSTLVAIEGTVE